MSLRLLPFSGRRLGEWPALLVITAREEELATAPTLGQALAELERDGHVLRLALAPLSAGDTTLLAEAGRRLEAARGSFTSGEARFELARVPIALAELAADRGDPHAAAGHAEAGRALAAALAAPALAALVDEMETRLRRRSPPERPA